MAQQPPGAAGAGAQPAVRVDPFRAYNFKLDIMGVTEAHFTDCTGLGVDVESISYREGGTTQVVRKIPGPVTYADVTLRYGVTSSHQVWDWLLSAVEGKVQRKNVSVIMLDADGVTEVLRWDLVDAWPTRWRGAPLEALNRAIAIEQLTIAFESMQRVA
jgi:phage tail-like protein